MSPASNSNNDFPDVIKADVQLQQSATKPTPDQNLWSAIRNRTDAIGFNYYAAFINRVLCTKTDDGTATCQEDEDERGGGARQKKLATKTASDIGAPPLKARRDDLEIRPSIYGVDAYRLLKLATQAFLLFETGVVITPLRGPGSGIPTPDDNDGPVPGEESRRGELIEFDKVAEELNDYLMQAVGPVTGKSLPYLKRILQALVPQDLRAQKLPYCEAILQRRLSCPSLLELIWSYWHEEGMLVQTMNNITVRFQNRRKGPQDPLANLELDPLRPLNHLLWGFIQDEQNRLTVQRRAYEYDHHYGITLYGKALSNFDPADSRSKFIKAFHNLLYRAAIFYHEDADTTVIADGFSLLNALKEVHLILAEGAHNQFGDLPWTARVEMFMTQWFLARPEMREFLRGRHMVPYREPWMGAVDAMKKLQGWTDVTISHFRDLGVFGEQIVLSVRYGDWVDINDQEAAKNWARYWRPEIQSYIHSYLATTGVDLATDATDTRREEDKYLQPSIHLRNRLAEQGNGRILPSRSPEVQVLPEPSVAAGRLPGVQRRLLSRKSGGE